MVVFHPVLVAVVVCNAVLHLQSVQGGMRHTTEILFCAHSTSDSRLLHANAAHACRVLDAVGEQTNIHPSDPCLRSSPPAVAAACTACDTSSRGCRARASKQACTRHLSVRNHGIILRDSDTQGVHKERGHPGGEQ